LWLIVASGLEFLLPGAGAQPGGIWVIYPPISLENSSIF